MIFDDNFAYFFIKTCCGCSLNRPGEAILMSIHNIGFYAEVILMSTHNKGFYEELTKNIIQLSSKQAPYLFFCDMLETLERSTKISLKKTQIIFKPK